MPNAGTEWSRISPPTKSCPESPHSDRQFGDLGVQARQCLKLWIATRCRVSAKFVAQVVKNLAKAARSIVEVSRRQHETDRDARDGFLRGAPRGWSHPRSLPSRDSAWPVGSTTHSQPPQGHHHATVARQVAHPASGMRSGLRGASSATESHVTEGRRLALESTTRRCVMVASTRTLPRSPVSRVPRPTRRVSRSQPAPSRLRSLHRADRRACGPRWP